MEHFYIDISLELHTDKEWSQTTRYTRIMPLLRDIKTPTKNGVRPEDIHIIRAMGRTDSEPH